MSVDSYFSETKNVSLYKDWNATLNQTDIRNNHNKYYILQLLNNDEEQSFYVWTRWGRVGQVSGTQVVYQGNSLVTAKKEFCKKFRAKTKNDWYDRSNFAAVKGSYTLLETQTSDAVIPLLKQLSLVDDKVVRLMQFMWDGKTLQSDLTSMTYDVKKLPLGKLSLAHLKKAYRVLDRLSRPGLSPREREDWSSDFYTLIPHIFKMRERPPVIETNVMIQNKVKMLDSLVHMIDGLACQNNYESLKCEIEALDPVRNRKEWKVISHYVENTQPLEKNITLLEVFCLKKVDLPPCKIGTNHKLLWHGSRVSNFPGILRQGLRIAPPEAPSSGYLFGKGVYFADMLAKSAQYCSPVNNLGLALLCDVTLGKPKLYTESDYNASQLPKGYSSSQAIGKIQPDPTCDVTHPVYDNLIVPIGKGISTSQKTHMQFNEYIVYDTTQVNMQYLVKLKFT